MVYIGNCFFESESNYFLKMLYQLNINSKYEKRRVNDYMFTRHFIIEAIKS